MFNAWNKADTKTLDIHFTLMFILAKVFKLDMFTACVASPAAPADYFPYLPKGKIFLAFCRL